MMKRNASIIFLLGAASSLNLAHSATGINISATVHANKLVFNLAFKEPKNTIYASIKADNKHTYQQVHTFGTPDIEGHYNHIWQTDITYEEGVNYQFRFQGKGDAVDWLPGPKRADYYVLELTNAETDFGQDIWLKYMRLGSQIAQSQAAERASQEQQALEKQRLLEQHIASDDRVEKYISCQPTASNTTELSSLIVDAQRSSTNAAQKQNDLYCVQTYRYEAEKLDFDSSTGMTAIQDDKASGGIWVRLDALSDQEYVSFDLPVYLQGTYEINIGYKSWEERGTAQVLLNGLHQGPPWSQSSKEGHRRMNLGQATFKSTGNHQLRMQVAGTQSYSYMLTIDYIELIPKGHTQQASTEMAKPHSQGLAGHES